MATIRQLVRWNEQQLACLIVTEGLHVAMTGMVQGPLTLTYKLRLLQPSRQALNKLLQLGPAIATAVQAEGVRVSRAADAILVEIPLPPAAQRTPSALTLLRHSQGAVICVGLDQFRKPVTVDIRQHGTLFWIGPSRRGKTQSMKCALFALAARNPGLDYVILSQKRADWQRFAGAATCLGLVSEPDEALTVLDRTTALLQQRAAQGAGKPLVIVADDLLNLLSQAPDLSGPLAEIASMGAGLGVHLLAGTQEAGSRRGTGGAGVENNATAKILYRSSSAAAAARATGQGAEGVQQLTGAKGDALLLVDGVPQRIATGWADDGDIRQLPQGDQGKHPWRTAGASAGTHTGTASADVPPATRERTAVPESDTPSPSPADSPETGGTGTAVRIGTLPLPDREPDAEARAQLRALYAEHGSKNQVLKLAWGGVVNASGKTPKTKRWLDAALEETDTEDSPPAADTADTERIDLNTPEGVATVERLIAQGLLARDTITETVREEEVP